MEEDFFDDEEDLVETVEVDRSDSKYKNIKELETYAIKCLLTSQTLISRL